MNKYYAQIKIFECITETMQSRVSQYSSKTLGKKTGLNYEKLNEELLEDLKTAMELCRKLDK